MEDKILDEGPLVYRACDIHFWDNVQWYVAHGYDEETAKRLAYEDEDELLHALEEDILSGLRMQEA